MICMGSVKSLEGCTSVNRHMQLNTKRKYGVLIFRVNPDLPENPSISSRMTLHVNLGFFG